MKIAVTGATGALGSLVLEHLLGRGTPAGQIAALVRDPEKAADLRAKGLDVRAADYDNEAGFVTALQGIDRLLLISGNQVGGRQQQHERVIRAAKTAGVKQVIYTSLIQADRSSNPLAGEHLGTERFLQASGLDWVILRNNWYTENYAGDLLAARDSGELLAAVRTGRVASALRTEYAEAAAAVLTSEGHSRQVYELAGPSWSFAELAAEASRLLGKPVQFRSITEAEQRARLEGFGVPAKLAAFFASIDPSIEAGSLAYTGPDLARLLGRAPLPLAEALKTLV